MSEIEIDIIKFSWNEQRGIDSLGQYWTVSNLLDHEGDEFDEGEEIGKDDVSTVVLERGGQFVVILLEDYTETGMN